MGKKKLLRTNLLVGTILIIGFILTAIFSYKANYQSSLSNIEQVSALSADGIYHQITAELSKPVNISLTMAHDSLLVEHLSKEPADMRDASYEETTKTYLAAYRSKYHFDSVFLIFADSGRYYNFNGFDRVLNTEDSENTWYYELLSSNAEYTLSVDNDEVNGAENEITVFVNCKIQKSDGKVIGVVGVGIRVNYLKTMLKEYEDKFNVYASLVNQEGIIEVSTTYTGFEQIDWFEAYEQKNLRNQILAANENTENMKMWTHADFQKQKRSFVVSRYIPELSWHLIVAQDTSEIMHQMYVQFFWTCFILVLVIAIVLFVITSVIRNFNKRITELIEERQASFKNATEQLYDSICEFNLTQNCCVGKAAKEYFARFGAVDVPFDRGLKIIAQKQIKEEYREEYVSLFCPQNAVREYKTGNNHLRYDFMMTEDGSNYHWMRVETYIFFCEEDHCIHMYSYRKNIDREKQKELLALTDEMTGFLTKTATERIIDKQLTEQPTEQYALFIFDIDNFKHVNDHFGHIFGDHCIIYFTQMIQAHFRESTIMGRIGGDEFAVFIGFTDRIWLEQKAAELSMALDMVYTEQNQDCPMSASIGIAIYPQDGTHFDTLYHCADIALYQTKKKGKNGYTVYSSKTVRKEFE